MKSIHPVATGSSGSPLRGAVLGLALLAAAAVSPAAASAATMSLALDKTRAGANEPVVITASGTADRQSSVRLYARRVSSGPCATTPAGEDANMQQQNSTIIGSNEDPGKAPGTYSYRGEFRGQAGDWHVCGYLNSVANQTGTPDASATGGPITVIGDADRDGVGDDVDKCPNEPPRDPATGQPVQTADGCSPADRDGDRIADADDRCPLENVDSGAAPRDPARPGCLQSGFRVVFGDSFDTFTGRRSTKGEKFIVQTTGFLRTRSFKVTVTLSAATAKKAGIAKRQIAATTATIPDAGTTFRNVYKRPTAKAAIKSKLRKLRSVSFKYAYTLTLVDGQTRTRTDSYTLKKDKGTGIFHTVFGAGTNAAGEEN